MHCLWVNCYFFLGPLTEASIPIDRLTRKAKGFAFITYMIPEHAVKAFSDLDGTVFQVMFNFNINRNICIKTYKRGHPISGEPLGPPYREDTPPVPSLCQSQWFHRPSFLTCCDNPTFSCIIFLFHAKSVIFLSNFRAECYIYYLGRQRKTRPQKPQVNNCLVQTQ